MVRAGLLPRMRGGDVPGSRAVVRDDDAAGIGAVQGAGRSAAATWRSATRPISPTARRGDGAGIDRVLAASLPEGGEPAARRRPARGAVHDGTGCRPARFLDGLVARGHGPGGRLRVVATLRADYFDRPLASTGFAEVVDATTVTVAAMAPAEVEAAIVEPASRAGRAVERALVTELVNAVVDQPAALPSLQYTLYELVERPPDAS